MVMTSEVKFDLGFELCDLNYPDIHVHIASINSLNRISGHGKLESILSV